MARQHAPFGKDRGSRRTSRVKYPGAAVRRQGHGYQRGRETMLLGSLKEKLVVDMVKEALEVPQSVRAYTLPSPQ